MARPKEFDRGEVLDRAMEVFWEKGFEATSIQDLIDHMGIGRASLYDTFGSKRNLIFEAMDCYVARMRGKILDALSQPGPPRQVIHDFFFSLVEQEHGSHTRSCLVAKSALMTGRDNEQIMNRVCTFMNLVEDTFHKLLVQAQRAGELSRDKDPRALARFFVNSMQGISVTASARGTRPILEDVITMTLSVMDCMTPLDAAQKKS